MTVKNLKIIDPYEITMNECPVFIQSGDMRGFFGWGIRKRTKSNFNHSMIMRYPGKLVSQAKTYSEFKVGKYMKPGQIMKFWICKDITQKERTAIMLKVAYDLGQPWHKKMYDWAGVVGQLFGARWFNIPGLNYCSERVSSKIRCILPSISKHPTPEDIDTLFKDSERMDILGYYIGI